MFIKNKLKFFLTLFLLVFVVVSLVFAFWKERFQEKQVEIKNSPIAANHRYIAYYFHGSARCPSCYKIEKYTTETIKTKFENELKEGKLTLQVINVEEGMNNHFIQDYSLSTKSVVLSEVNEGKEVKWKNLDKIWELLGNETQFSNYIETELRSFLTMVN